MKTTGNNNAYQTEVVKKLFHLSETLIEEVNIIKGENYHSRIYDSIYTIAKKIQSNYSLAKKTNDIYHIKKENNAPTFLLDQYILADEIKGDPFIPKNIRTEVANFYQERYEVITDIYDSEIGKFCDEYFKLGNKYFEEKGVEENISIVLCHIVMPAIDKSNYGEIKNTKRIEKIRGMIEKYLLSL